MSPQTDTHLHFSHFLSSPALWLIPFALNTLNEFSLIHFSLSGNPSRIAYNMGCAGHSPFGLFSIHSQLRSALFTPDGLTQHATVLRFANAFPPHAGILYCRHPPKSRAFRCELLRDVDPVTGKIKVKKASNTNTEVSDLESAQA